MNTNVNVLPRRNLPGKADAWGREIETSLKDLDANRVQLEQAVNNGFRSTAGQLANTSRIISDIGDQVSELDARSLHVVNVPNITVTKGTSVGQSGPVNTTFSFPAPDADRSAVLSLSGLLEWSGTITSGGTISDNVMSLLTVTYSGSRISETMNLVESVEMMPASSGGRAWFLYVPLIIPAGSNPTFTLGIYAYKSFTGGQSNAGARAASTRASLQYGNKV